MIPEELPISKIDFHKEAITFELAKPQAISDWISNTIQQEHKKLGVLSFIFCSDDYLYQINKDYLQHDTLTDVITFPYSETLIEGDIFISIDRIRENAIQFKTTFENELHRVIIHGVLHLCGYGDKSAEEITQMRSKEEEYLSKL